MSSYLPRLRSLNQKVLDLIKPLYQTSRNCLESGLLVSKYLLIIVGKWSWPRLPKSVRPKTIWLIPWSTQSCVVFVPRKILAWKEIIKKCSSIGPPWEYFKKYSRVSIWVIGVVKLATHELGPNSSCASPLSKLRCCFLQLCKLFNCKRVLKGPCLATRIRIENLENTLGRKLRYFESVRRLWISIRCALYSTIVWFNHSKIPERVLLHKTTIYSQ